MVIYFINLIDFNNLCKQVEKIGKLYKEEKNIYSESKYYNIKDVNYRIDYINNNYFQIRLI